MERIEWKFGKGSEWYKVLYRKHGFIMVQSEGNELISFGQENDFGSFYGFPVNNSCLTIGEAKERIKRLLEINKKKEYAELEKLYLESFGWNHIIIDEDMLSAINSLM